MDSCPLGANVVVGKDDIQGCINVTGGMDDLSVQRSSAEWNPKGSYSACESGQDTRGLALRVPQPYKLVYEVQGPTIIF